MNVRSLRWNHDDAPLRHALKRIASASWTKPRLTLTVLLSALSGCILLGAIFFTRGYPGRDSGVFLYIGQQILNGAIPYRDAWDNKPPGVFYIDAFGLALGGGSLLGVWLVEFASLCASVVLCVKTLDRAFGLSGMFFGSVSWLVGLTLLFTVGGPNLQEEYAIPLKFAAFWLFLRCEDEGYAGWKGLVIGATGAAALLLRQNLVGVHVAIGIYLLASRGRRLEIRKLFSEYLWIGAGGAIVLLAVLGYFALHSALGDLIEAAFLYNLHYSDVSIQGRLDSVFAGFNELARSGLGVIGVASWIASLAYLAAGREQSRDARRLLALAALTFPTEIVLASVSGRGYGHYFQAWLPAVAVLAGFFAKSLLAGRSDEPGHPLTFSAITWQLALISGMILMPAYATIAGSLPIGRPAPAIDHAAAYVKEFTQPTDYVLVWGMEPSINFMSHRRSPTRYLHQYPLLTRGYVTAAMVDDFLAELDAHPPALIIDTSPVNGLIPPISDDRREGWKRWGPTSFYAPSPDMDRVFAYFDRSYRERGPLVQPSGAVFVYERKPVAQ